ncbi:MAG TPA: hypothetical protein PL176_08040, partial [Kiritimatiellia bacterium]|nr:hypothetical protein [Kiritimatiellia bacterium]
TPAGHHIVDFGTGLRAEIIDNLRKWERQEKLERAEEAAAEIAAGDDGPGLGQLMKPAQSAQPATPPEIPAAAPALP